LAMPACKKGLGTEIKTINPTGLIEGVQLDPILVWSDDRGYFLEILRQGQGLVADYEPLTTQVSAALSYPGTIKAFHYHVKQTDCWAVAAGMVQVALADLRRGSRTFGARNTLYVGTLRPWRILIPPGVAHGYKVVGMEPAVLIYATDRFYDPSDEGRIAHDDPRIHYDWETQYK